LGNGGVNYQSGVAGYFVVVHTQSDVCTRPPPEMEEDSDVSLGNTLYKLIFRFCVKKFEKRVFKYWG